LHDKSRAEKRVGGPGAYKASGQRVPAWCAAQDVKAHQLRYWIQKLEPAQSAAKPSAMWLTMEVDLHTPQRK